MQFDLRRLFYWPVAEIPDARWMLVDLIVLADDSGVVNMTPHAIAWATHRSFQDTDNLLAMLESPPTDLRSWRPDGAWIVRLSGLQIGWKIADLPGVQK
jgi:hypothetical protein